MSDDKTPRTRVLCTVLHTHGRQCVLDPQAQLAVLTDAASEIRDKYVRHWLGCHCGPLAPCTCGLDDALAALDAALDAARAW